MIYFPVENVDEAVAHREHKPEQRNSDFKQNKNKNSLLHVDENYTRAINEK